MSRCILYQADAVTVSNQAIRVADAVYPIGHLTAVKLVEELPHPLIRGSILRVLATVFGINLIAGSIMSGGIGIGSLVGISVIWIAWAGLPGYKPRARAATYFVDLHFANGDIYRISGNESVVRCLHAAAVNAIGLARG